MEDRHCRLLRKQRMYLLKNIGKVDMIIEQLYSSEILTEEQKDDILSRTTPSSQRSALLDCLPRRGADAYSAFCDALSKEGYQFVVDALHEAESVMETSIKERPDASLESNVLGCFDQATRGRRITERELSMISLDFPGSKFSLIGSLMDLSQGRVEQIIESCPRNAQLQLQTLFFEWRQKLGQRATVEAFVRLMHEGKVDVDVYLPKIQRPASAAPQGPDPSLPLQSTEQWV